jgi:N-acetylmuramoyl-L-alanine amidase
MFFKNLYRILLIFLLLITIAPLCSYAKNEPFVLVLDAGHGGKDPGAVGKRGKEKNINLAVALLAGKYIAEKHPDVKIIYTRDKDKFLGLYERANIANKSKANLFVSIHTNSAKTKTARGPEVFTFGVDRTAENLEVAQKENSVILLEDNYEEKYEGFDPTSAESYIMFQFLQNKFVEQSINFASMVQEELTSCVNWAGRGVKQAGFLLLRQASMPRVLVELDFISNQAAENFLLSDAGQKKYARAICNAFTQYKMEYDRKTIGYTQENTTNSDENTILYKVQLFSTSNQLPEKSPHLKGYKADYYVENNLYKYTHGESTDWNEISKVRNSLLKDFKDAFIVAFRNGVRVSIK